MNLNEWAKEITLKEGKKVQTSIAQIKEILRIVLTDLAAMPLEEMDRHIDRYRKVK